ncbi:hypothetical protein NESM_000856300 [Novymonas esmeraldas]|uniref:Uncharacterized protein n=1 Tax=Novymonas esmeraldas TaxID=1808958 RepID=A0AAW0F0Z4_9TRYP
MNSVSAAPLTEADVAAMSTAEVRANLERCARLVTHAALLHRLPDGGASIRHRHTLFTNELEQRRVTGEAKAAEVAAAAPAAVEERKRSNEAALLSESGSTATSAAREMAEKYRDQRVDVEATVRRMYEGAVSEGEIQRIIHSVPPHFFLTYAETCEMERQLAKEARRAELQKLAAHAGRHTSVPQ